ncbi:Tetratricopeptide TPR_1 repeat-containing protein [Leptonema illini DSM 21528]|uniref:Tetratricopeptide TPR_1 repeat-containing protein n=2 Tax=Leptonema illini TaxID=183 RepID=H2CCZ5_9LEPT|nr:Tetratricopeptide TPR_1 repeat-containing protein [Leptonema illini DSM 21528]
MKRIFYLIPPMSVWFFAFFPYGKPIAAEPNAQPDRSQESSSERSTQQSVEESARLEREYLKKGEDHFFARRFGAALQWFRRAIDINPDNALAHAYTGDILLSLGEPDQALKHFRVAAELKSDPAPEYFRIGQIYYLKKEREQSEQYFKRALKSDPTLVEAHFYLGLLSYRMGRNREETLTHLKAFRAARPDFTDKEALNRAIALLEDPATKLDQSRDLIDIDPLRLFYRKENEQKDTARTETESKDAEDKPVADESTEKNENIAQTEKAEDQAQTEKAEKQTEDKDGFLTVAAGPGSLFNQALVFRDENPTRALQILDRAIKEDARDARLHSLRCEILFRSKADTAGALKACAKATELAPDYRNLQNLGRVQEAAEKRADAYASYVEALNRKMEPDLAMHAIKLGETLPGKEQETRRLLERMLARRPDHREGLLTLMRRQKEDKNRVGIRTTMERLQSLYSDDVEVLERMAMILLSDPDTETEAVELLKRYYDRTGDLRAGLSLSGLYLKRENEKEALVLLAELYEKHPENHDVVRTILILFVRRNQNLDSAERIARSFLATNPPAEQRAAILGLLPNELRNRIDPPVEKQVEKDGPAREPSRQPVRPNTPVQP